MNPTQRRQILKDIGIEVWSARAPKVDTASTEQELPVASEPIVSDWNSLEQAVQNCRACDLANSRTNVVFGIGNQQAKLLVIGEAPSKDEDLKGEPFVGAAGKLLDAMLLSIGFRRSEVFIANVIKCKPPNNRDPDLSEITKCSDFLYQQIALIKPEVILCVGRVAAQTLLASTLSIGHLRGQVHKYPSLDIPLIATYHPAYLLRKPKEKAKAWQDLKLVFEQLSL